MNEVVKAVMEHEFKSRKKMNKLKRIAYNRASSARVKNRAFKALLSTFMKERPIAILGEVVLIKNEYFLELKSMIDKKEKELEQWKN